MPTPEKSLYNSLRITPAHKGNMTMDITERREPSAIADAGKMADRWVVKLSLAEDIGPLLPDFTRWLNADLAHRRAFVVSSQIWEALGGLPAEVWARILPEP